MKVDAFRPEAQGGSDAAGDVVDREFADAVYVSDPVTYRVKKIAKGSTGRDERTRQCIRGVPQDMGRDTALVGMSFPAWKLRQCGSTDGTRKAGMACPMDVLGLGAWPVVPAIVANDFGQ